jgi:hypothetical protein
MDRVCKNTEKRIRLCAVPLGSGVVFALRHMPTQPPDPVCKAILLCQKTIVEEGTSLVSLISLFDGFGVRDNGKTAEAEVFCRLTEAQGKYRLSVEIHELANGNAVAGTDEVVIEIRDRLATTNVIFPIPPLPLRPGQYDIVVFANDTIPNLL